MTIQEEIQNGESRTLEFKKELPAESLKWIKTIAAFANGAGGRLVIGVSNQREIIGISKETDIFELKDKISDTISQMCTPQLMYDIYQESIKNKVLIVVEVFPGNDTPYFIKSFGKENGTFIRLDATTRNADITTIDELELRGKRRYYDELPFTELDVTENDIATLCNEFSKRAKHEITTETLVNMHVLQKRENILVATKAYAIFLGKHDNFSKIQCARFKGVERVHFIDKKDFDGTLLSQVEGAYNFVLEHINLGVEIKGLYRKEQYELPEAIIRELILNAVIHRNYMMSSCVQVAVYDDRVEISSPGSLFGTLTLQEALSGRSSIRNKVIAGVCEKLGVVEGWGTGLKRTIDVCHEMNIREPEFLEIGDLLRVNLYRPTYKAETNTVEESRESALESDKLPCKCTVNVPEIALKTYSALKENPRATSAELAEILGIALRTVKNHISILKKCGSIERVGSDKSGYWKITENGES